MKRLLRKITKFRTKINNDSHVFCFLTSFFECFVEHDITNAQIIFYQINKHESKLQNVLKRTLG